MKENRIEIISLQELPDGQHEILYKNGNVTYSSVGGMCVQGEILEPSRGFDREPHFIRIGFECVFAPQEKEKETKN